MILFLAALLCQDPAADIKSLIRDLGDESIEVRERAHRLLLGSGEAGLSALEMATYSDDAEVRARARAIAYVVGRGARERAQDDELKQTRLRLNRNVEAERRLGSGATEGARFDLQSSRFGDGWVITTSVKDYLESPYLDKEGRGGLTLDVRSIVDASGKDVEIQRCGKCSPRKVFVKSPSSALAVRLRGEQVWFSPYNVEFSNPSEGQFKEVGDFRIEIAWPNLRVTSSRSFPTSWLSSMGRSFEVEVDHETGIGVWGASYC